MMRLAFITLLLISNIAFSKVYVISDMSFNKDDISYCGYYTNGTFDDYDKALYVYEEIISRGGNAYVINVDKGRTLNLHESCLMACYNELKNFSYPSNFRKDLFIADYENLIKRSKNDVLLKVKCKASNLDDLYNLFKHSNDELFIELGKYLKRR